MTPDEAVQRLQVTGLSAKASKGEHMVLIGGQWHVPPIAPMSIGVFGGVGFHISVEAAGFVTRWASGPQQVEERHHPTLEAAVQAIIENVPALPHYTAEEIKAAVEADRETLFASYAANRPANWSCDPRTKDLVAIGNWIDREHRHLGLDDLGRITQGGRFNRESRSRDDLWVLAAEIMADTLIDKIPRDRRPHRRWG